MEKRQAKVFNSHPHKEDDLFNINVVDLIDFSTHILTRRMTIDTQKEYTRSNFSTHILTRRMTSSSNSYQYPSIFQLTSSQGG